MTASFVPVLRLYRLSPLRAPCLPAIALLYTAMTVDSARRHYAGRGGEWKGRTVPAGQQGSGRALALDTEDHRPGVTAGGGQGDDG